jgi:hypothetical protein
MQPRIPMLSPWFRLTVHSISSFPCILAVCFETSTRHLSLTNRKLTFCSTCMLNRGIFCFVSWLGPGQPLNGSKDSTSRCTPRYVRLSIGQRQLAPTADFSHNNSSTHCAACTFLSFGATQLYLHVAHAQQPQYTFIARTRC